MTRRADRLLLSLEKPRSRRISTADAVAEDLEVSARTVYRDIEALIGADVPVRGERGVGYALDPGYYLPPLNLTHEEAEAVALGAHILATWIDTAVSAQAGAALANFRAVLPAGGQSAIDQEIFWVPLWVTREAPSVDLHDLKRAAQNRRVLEITYETLNGTRSIRAVRPLSVSFFGSVWLLVAWCEVAEDFRCFRLDQIRAMTPTGRTFRDEAGKSLADFKRSKGEQAAATSQLETQ